MAKDFYTATLTTGDTVPAKATDVSVTGSILTGNKVVTGTNLTDLKPNDWIVDTSGIERVRVDKIESSTKLKLKKAFSSDLDLSTLSIVRAEDCKAVYMDITPTGATIDGVTVPDGVPVSFGNKNDSGADTKFVRPRIVSGDVTVNIEYFNNEYAD